MPAKNQPYNHVSNVLDSRPMQRSNPMIGRATLKRFAPSHSWSWPLVSSLAARKTLLSLAPAAWGNPNHRNTPLVTEVCAGEIEVVDPTHPLFGKRFQLSGLATLPGNVRYCHVDLGTGQYGYVAIASTSRATGLQPAGTILTPEAITDLLTLYRTVSRKKRSKHEGQRR